MDGPVLEEKSSFKMLELTFSSKLDWGSYIISIPKTDSKKIGIVRQATKTNLQDCVVATSLEPLAHRRNVASLSLFYRYYFGRCSSEPAQVFPLPFSRGRCTRYSDGLHDFSVTIPRCYKNVYVNSFFPRTARLWNSLPTECFYSIYNLNGFMSRINRHLLTVGSF